MDRIERINDLPISVKNLVLINIAEQNNLERAIFLESKNSLIKWSFDIDNSNEGKEFWERVLQYRKRYANDFRFDKKYQRELLNLTPDVKIKRLSKNDIITEMVDYYSNYPKTRRASRTGKHKSVYKVFATFDGKVSPIGKCATTDNRNLLINADCRVKSILNNFNILSLDDLFEERYKGHSIEFWEDLEELHNENLYWGEARLHSRGELFVNQIRKKWHNISGDITPNDYKIRPYKIPKPPKPKKPLLPIEIRDISKEEIINELASIPNRISITAFVVYWERDSWRKVMNNGYRISNKIRNDKNDIFLHENYRGHSHVFWDDLEQLHFVEGSKYWDKSGLNNVGKEYVNTLKRRWCGHKLQPKKSKFKNWFDNFWDKIIFHFTIH